MATKKSAQDVTINILKGTSRTVDFTKIIDAQRDYVRKAERLAGLKPSKVEVAYIEEQKIKLNQLEDVVRSWIWEAFEDEDEIIHKTSYWSEIQKHFNITVIVEKI
jgi:hypothetical protein